MNGFIRPDRVALIASARAAPTRQPLKNKLDFDKLCILLGSLTCPLEQLQPSVA